MMRSSVMFNPDPVWILEFEMSAMLGGPGNWGIVYDEDHCGPFPLRIALQQMEDEREDSVRRMVQDPEVYQRTPKLRIRNVKTNDVVNDLDIPQFCGWRIEVYNPKQEEWNLYSAIRLRPTMADLTLEEATAILKQNRDTRPGFSKTLRLRNDVTGDIIMADVLR